MLRKLIIFFMLIICSISYGQTYPFPVGEFNATINYDGVGPYEFWLRSTLNSSGQRIYNDPRIIYTPESFITQYGVGAGGWSYAIDWYQDSESVFVGQDIGGVYRSNDSGDSWLVDMGGINNDPRVTYSYTRHVQDLISVNNSYFSGMFMSLIGGVYKKDISTTDWEPVTINNSNMYYFHDPNRPDDIWKYIDNITFAGLSWDEETPNVVFGTAGRRRYQTLTLADSDCGIRQPDRYDFNYYPNYVKEDDGTSNWGCPYGVSTLWVYDYTSQTPEFKPVDLNGTIVQNPTKLTNGNLGAGKYIDITTVGGEKIVAMTTERGVYLYNYTTRQWFDNNGDMDMMSYPFYCTESEFTSRYGSSYTFSDEEYCSTLGRNFYRGEMLNPWAVHLTKHGELYVAFLRPAVSVVDWLYVAGGIYKFDINNPENGWIMLEGFNPRIYCSGGNCNGQELYRSFYDYCIYDEAKNLIYMDVYEGVEETDTDIIYLMDRENTLAGNCFRIEANNTFSSSIIDTVVNITPIGHLATRGLGREDGSWRSANKYWEYYGVCNPAINPNNPDQFIIQASYDLMRFTYQDRSNEDHTSGWEFIHGRSEYVDDIQYFTHNGFTEIAVRGIKWLDDDRYVAFTGDNGLFWQRGKGSDDKQWFQYSNAQYTPYTSNYGDHQIFESGSEDVEIIYDWCGTGNQKLFALYGHPSFPKCHRIMMADIIDGVVPDNESTDWDSLTKILPDELYYRFYDIEPVENTNSYDLYVTYRKYDNIISNGGIQYTSGILKFTYNCLTSQWSYEEFNDGLSTYIYNGQVYPSKIPYLNIRYSPRYNSLAVASRHNGYRYTVRSSGCDITMTSGGVWICDLNQTSPTWVQVIGENISDYTINTTTCTATQSISNNFTLFGDIMDIDWYNNMLYFSSAGETGDGYGTVGQIVLPSTIPNVTNPQQMRSYFTLNILANDSSGNIPFGFVKPYNPRYNSSSDLTINRAMSQISGVFVDDYTGDVYASVYAGNADAFSSQTGLWKYSGGEWEKCDLGVYDGYANYGINGNSETREISLHTFGADFRVYNIGDYTPEVYVCPDEVSDFISLSYDELNGDLQIDVDMDLPSGSSSSIMEFRYIVFDGYSVPSGWSIYETLVGTSFTFSIDTNLLPENINFGAPALYSPSVVYSWKFTNSSYTSNCSYYGYTGALSPFSWAGTPYKIQIPRP